MDANPTPQTVAQAVQAATQAAQQVSQSPPLQVAPPAQGSTIDNLTCQWQGCGARCDSAEALYDHVCERHVGRKSTNNLNLTCQWGACRTTTVKRDHITSHIRVHVPLKPHKCDFCGKAFKRPQDLKKHVKTHADESVLNMSSPQHRATGRGMTATAGLGQPNAFPPAAGYYGHDGMTNPYSAYQTMGNGSTPAYPPPANNGQYAGYGSVSYPNSTGAMQDLQSYNTRRRAIEALNDFLGDIKRRAIDPSSYYDVGHRLQSNTLPLPISSGYNTGYNNSVGYNNNSFSNTASLLESFNNGGSSGSGGLHNPITSHGYSLSLNNARTKNDLQDIDHFLEQLQTTVYEASNHSAAAGVIQNGVHNTYAGNFGNFGGHSQGNGRGSNSPSSIGDSSMGGTSAIGSLPNMAVSQGGVGTPALTPASISSYDSAGHSPLSSHSRTSLGQMYPNLPTVPSTSQIGSDYPTTTSAPPSSLAYGMEPFDTRRYGGSNLQRQAPQQQDTEMADATDHGSRTPKASSHGKSHSSIDPALRDADEKLPSESVSSPGIDAAEQWVVNIRTIEALRKWISQRLKDGEYEDGEGAGSSGNGNDDSNNNNSPAAQAEDDANSKNVEIAKLVEQSMADAVAGEKTEADDVKYPTLPSS